MSNGNDKLMQKDKTSAKSGSKVKTSELELRQHKMELLRKTQYLEAASEVARVATSTLDLDGILSTSVDLIREKFEFYHASVFLVEPDSNMAVLRESTGEAGKQLKARNHQLAIGSRSLVGAATASHQPVIVQDVSEDPTHYKNPLLPDTKAEAVIPLLAGDILVGTLDVQSTIVDSFSESDVAILTTLGNQLAIAIQNARLYEALQDDKIALEISVQERTKELSLANTQLIQSLSTLQATFESTEDGILVVNNDGEIASFNQRFVDMWQIPEKIMASRDDDEALRYAVDQLMEPDAFLEKVRELYSQPDAESNDLLHFKDGRVFERYSQPYKIHGKSVGRVWSFRDITESKQAEQLQNTAYLIAQAANEEVSLEKYFATIHSAIKKVMRADNFYIALYDPETDMLNFPFSVDQAETDTSSTAHKAGKGLTAHVLHSGQSFMCDAAAYQDLIDSGEIERLGVHHAIWLGVPLIVKGEIIGVMAVQDYEDDNAYQEREKQLL